MFDKPRYTIAIQVGALALTVSAAAVIRWMGAGWFAITTGIVLYAGVLVAHTTLHVMMLLGRSATSRRQLGWIWISHVALLMGFLVQYDAGDSSGFFVFETILGWGKERLGGWSWDTMSIYNALVLLPWSASWVYALTSTRRERRNQNLALSDNN